MESKRQQKFAGVLQEELAQVYQREGGTFLPNTLVTITRVRVSPDLAVAKVYLSLLTPPIPHYPSLRLTHMLEKFVINWVPESGTKLG